MDIKGRCSPDLGMVYVQRMNFGSILLPWKRKWKAIDGTLPYVL